MKGRRQVEEGFLSLETIETWTIQRVDLNGGFEQTNGGFEQGMVVGARRTGLCQELQHCWVFHAKQFLVCIKNGPTPKGHPAN